MAWHNKPNPAKTPQVAVPKAPTPKPIAGPKPAAKPTTPTTEHHHAHHVAHPHVTHKKVTHPHVHHPKPPPHKAPKPVQLAPAKANAKPVQQHSVHKVVATRQVTPDITKASKKVGR